MKLLSLFLLALPFTAEAQTRYNLHDMQMEHLGRGLVAVRASEDSVLLSWRYLQDDPLDLTFDLYRDGRKIATVPARHSTTFMDYNPTQEASVYELRGTAKATYTLPAKAPIGYLDIPLDTPPAGPDYAYTANDATMADLDGDGEMEIILKWDPTNSRDNSQSGLTGPVLVDAYRLSGERLWRIDLGKNIRAGAHYTQIMAYDLDGNGRAEVVMKTGDGTTDGEGHIIGDRNADHRQLRATEGSRGHLGFISSGAEYLTVFEGTTGRAIHTIDYVPPRGEMSEWGDSYANRCDRFLACVAYLDGKHPSVVMCRGYYTRMTLAAFDFDGKQLRQRWFFDSKKEGREYDGQGNHNLRVGDVDGDGRDEIIYGSAAIDDDGHGLYSMRMGHGDAMHLTAFRPLDDQLFLWDCHENKRDGSELHDAATGEIIFQIKSNDDVGRCMAADIDETNPGLEMWSSRSLGLRDYKGGVVDSLARIPVNFGLWWDGDLLREMLDHETISKYSARDRRTHPMLLLEGCRFNNGTKSNPSLCCDIVGDWREEVLARTADSRSLRLYVSTLPTPYRFHTFLQEPVYRLSVAAQNVAYNQPTCLGLYFGAELEGSHKVWRGWNF